MRPIALLLLVASGSALAAPKGLPPTIAKAAGAAFAAAQEADAKGELADAVRQYERAIAIAPHPAAYYNLADVEVRAKQITPAIAAFEKYLELAPDAPDREEVRRRIAELRELTGTLEVECDEPDGLIFVDGQPAGRAPAKVAVRAGGHHVDVITPITHGWETCLVEPLHSRSCRVGARPRTDGNVVMGATWRFGGLSWPVGDQRFRLDGRFTARPGTYQLKVHDRQCAPLTLEVPPGDGITYAFVTAPEVIESSARGCVDLRIEQRRVTF